MHRFVETGDKSLNSGFVAFTHGGGFLPEIVTKFAFAHEIGHSFGSPVRTDVRSVFLLMHL